jgi:hypothetical protein
MSELNAVSSTHSLSLSSSHREKSRELRSNLIKILLDIFKNNEEFLKKEITKSENIINGRKSKIELHNSCKISLNHLKSLQENIKHSLNQADRLKTKLEAMNQEDASSITSEDREKLKPRNYFIWAWFIAPIICFSAPALYFATKTRDANINNDLKEAQKASRKTLILNVAGTIAYLFAITFIIQLVRSYLLEK